MLQTQFEEGAGCWHFPYCINVVISSTTYFIWTNVFCGVQVLISKQEEDLNIALIEAGVLDISRDIAYSTAILPIAAR